MRHTATTPWVHYLGRLCVTVCLVGAGGCATSKGIQKAPLDAGNAQVFDAPFDRVLAATRESMMELKLGINTDKALDDRTHMLVGEIGMSAFSYGEVVRAIVKEQDDGTSVRVRTQRKLATNVVAKGDWSKDIFKKVRQKLGSPRPLSSIPTKG